MLQYVASMVNRLDVDSGRVRVGLLTFSTEPTIYFHLNQYKTKSEVIKAIDAIPYVIGSTNTAEAIQTARLDMFQEEKGDRLGILNVLIVLTDGVSNLNQDQTVSEATLAHNNGIQVYSIGIGLVEWTHELDQIASPPSNVNRYVVKDFEELPSIEEKFLGQMCDGRTSGYLVMCPNRLT